MACQPSTAWHFTLILCCMSCFEIRRYIVSQGKEILQHSGILKSVKVPITIFTASFFTLKICTSLFQLLSIKSMIAEGCTH